MKKVIGIGVVVILLVGTLIIFRQNKKVQNALISPPRNTSQKQTSITPYRISVGKIPSIPLQLPSGFVIHTFADGLSMARDLQFSPGGTLLVSNPAGNQVIAIPDKNGDGVADVRKVIIDDENHVHGLAFYNNQLFIADVDKVVRYNWDEQTLTATRDKVLFSLPSNNDHNNRTLIFDKEGKLYVSVGSTCNVCHESSNLSATILISDANGAGPTVFSDGLRNAPFLQLNPSTNELWSTEMGRDNLGDTIPPDEIDIDRQGKNYGWPLCYGDRIHDTNFDKGRTDPCQTTEAPTYQIPAHSAPLGLLFITSPQFPTDWQGDLLVAYHGSWNRSTATGYKVVHLKVSGNSISSSDDFLTGFLRGTTKDSSLGRPVDLTFDASGNLYLSDDKAGAIYIIQKAQ